MGTGFMKCVLITRDEAERSVGSVEVEAAILVMEMEDVFVARIAWDGHICASCAKILVFRSKISFDLLVGIRAHTGIVYRQGQLQ
jgi:hypothetical protein